MNSAVRRLSIAWSAAALLASPVAPASAQVPRSGFWAEGAGGPSRIAMSCAGCERTVSSGSGGWAVRAGGALGDEVLAGIEFARPGADRVDLEDRAEGEAAAETWSASAVVLWYPWRSAVSLQAGLGVAGGTITVEPEAGQPVEADGTGLGLSVGLGWEHPLSRHVGVSARVGTWVAAIGDVASADLFVDDALATSYALVLGVVIR